MQRGNTLAETEMFTKTTLVGDVPLQNEKTFYTQKSFNYSGSLFSIFFLDFWNEYFNLVKEKI